jgi:uncharacterized pyridoxamine 5'-phosphate oxidase family protein
MFNWNIIERKMKRLINFVFVFVFMSSITMASDTSPVDSLNQSSEEELFMKEVYDFLKKCETYFIATVEDDQPRVRPFGTVAIFENKLYIQTGKRKNVSKQMRTNPKIEICALDLSEGKWLRIEAVVVEDDRVEAKQYMLDEYPSLKSLYSADDDNTQALYLKNVTATFSSFTEEPKVVQF